MPAEGRRSRLPKFELHLITEPRRSFPDLLAAIEAAMAGGVTWVQLRDKSASAATMFRQGSDLLEATRRYGVKLAVNDRLDVALAVGADGVHLGQSDPGAERARARGLLLGRSAVNYAQAAEADADADYLGVGPVWATPSKDDAGPAIGLAELARICADVKVPVIAIGGIDASNAGDCIRAGAAGVAAIRAATDPGLREAVDETLAHR